MSTKTINLIYKVIDIINDDLDADEQIKKDETTNLFMCENSIDSVVFFNLIGELEDIVEESLDISISLITEEAMTEGESPFTTIGHLSTYLEKVIQEEIGD